MITFCFYNEILHFDTGLDEFELEEQPDLIPKYSIQRARNKQAGETIVSLYQSILSSSALQRSTWLTQLINLLTHIIITELSTR